MAYDFKCRIVVMRTPQRDARLLRRQLAEIERYWSMLTDESPTIQARVWPEVGRTIMYEHEANQASGTLKPPLPWAFGYMSQLVTA